MAGHIQNLREFIDIASNSYASDVDTLYEDFEVDESIKIASDSDSLIESLETLRFKLLNHRQMEGSSDYALGYEEACSKVVEMIDGIIRSHQ